MKKLTTILALSTLLLTACVTTVEKKKCDNTRKNNRKKMKQLRSNPGFKMGIITLKEGKSVC